MLVVKSSSQDARDTLLFKWMRGAQTALADFGDPLHSADYALCLYTGNQHTPLTHVTIPANSTKWSAESDRGYRYTDGGATAAGVIKARLKSGEAGKSRVQVKGKGVNLPDPTFSFLPLPVTAQLVNSQTNTCFEAVYQAAHLKKNDAGSFKAVTE
jgi:hypothetical protein